MYLWSIGVTLLLLFIGLKYSVAKNGICIVKHLSMSKESKKCAYNRFGREVPKGPAFDIDSDKTIDANEKCCFKYYLNCTAVKTARSVCTPTDEYSNQVKKKYEELKKCSPSKDKCEKYHKKLENCSEYSYPECEDYSWSSVTLISMNGWTLSLSLAFRLLVSLV